MKNKQTQENKIVKIRTKRKSSALESQDAYRIIYEENKHIQNHVHIKEPQSIVALVKIHSR
jgi:hypothetical protein